MTRRELGVGVLSLSLVATSESLFKSEGSKTSVRLTLHEISKCGILNLSAPVSMSDRKISLSKCRLACIALGKVYTIRKLES